MKFIVTPCYKIDCKDGKEVNRIMKEMMQSAEDNDTIDPILPKGVSRAWYVREVDETH